MRFTLTLFPFVTIAQIYIGRLLFTTLQNIFGVSKQAIFPYLGMALILFMIFPLILLLVKALNETKLEDFHSPKNKTLNLPITFFWIGVTLAVELTPWLALAQLIKYPFYPLYMHFSTLWHLIQDRVIFTLISFYTIYVALRMTHDTFYIRVKRLSAPIEKLSPQLAGLKIAHISDSLIGAHCSLRRLEHLLKKTLRANPDIMFFTGDFVEDGVDKIEKVAQLCGKFRPRFGMYACVGERDHRIRTINVAKLFHEQKIPIWKNQNKFIRIGSDNLMVTFLNNHPKDRAGLDKLNYLMGQQPRGSVDILVTHQPSESLVDLAAERGYHLFLCGHTLGGQMVFRILGFTFCAAKLETPFFRGSGRVGKLLINVSNGLGFAQTPIRLRSPAETTIFTLQPQDH